jgi:hypothetical protein
MALRAHRVRLTAQRSRLWSCGAVAPLGDGLSRGLLVFREARD